MAIFAKLYYLIILHSTTQLIVTKSLDIFSYNLQKYMYKCDI